MYRFVNKSKNRKIRVGGYQKILCFLRVETFAGMFLVVLVYLFSVATNLCLCYFSLFFLVDFGLFDCPLLITES